MFQIELMPIIYSIFIEISPFVKPYQIAYSKGIVYMKGFSMIGWLTSFLGSIVLVSVFGLCHGSDALVSLDTALSSEETDFRTARKVHTYKACQQFLGKKLTDLQQPTVALCFSGGGYRAMIETLGALAGAHDIGLLDAVMYTGGLSGSTWALTPWVLSGKSITEYLDEIKPNLNKFFSISLYSLNDIYALSKRRLAAGEPFGLVNAYGACLAANLLGWFVKKPQCVTLSDLAKNCDWGHYPLPVCTAVAGGVGNHDLWYECTPYTVGCMQTGFIKTHEFGRTFYDGRSLANSDGTYPLPRTLGDFMGIWGSAFAVDQERLKHEFEGMDEDAAYAALGQLGLLKYGFNRVLPTDTIIDFLNRMWPDKTKNFAAATVPNYAYKMHRSGIINWVLGKKHIPLSEDPELSLIDGGFDLVGLHPLNISIIPLLRPERAVDVIIICDSSAHLKHAPSLRAAQSRAQSLGLPFPEIDYTNIDTRSCSVFTSDKQGVPTIVYMPCIKNDAYGLFDPKLANYTTTTNFNYTSAQVTELSGLVRCIMQQNKGAIADALLHSVQKKRAWSLWG